MLVLFPNAVYTGKNIGSDSENGKTTFVTILGLEGAKTKAKHEASLAKASLDVLKAKGTDVSVLLELSDFIVNRDN